MSLDELGRSDGARPDSAGRSAPSIFHCGGTGARPGKDGLDVTAFPSGVRTIPVEATEAVAPVMFRRREFREGSGGVGQVPRRARPDHRAGRRRRHADGDAVQFRAHQQPGARPRRRRARRAGAGDPGLGQADPLEGPADHSGRRFHPARTAGRRRLRRPGRRAIPSRSRSMSPTGSSPPRPRARDYRVALAADGKVDPAATATLRAA